MRRLGLLLLLSTAAFGKTMKNGDIVRMVRQGASVSNIVAQINTSESGFVLFGEDVEALRRKGVPPIVIEAMFARNGGQTFRLPTAPASAAAIHPPQKESSTNVAPLRPEEPEVRAEAATSSTVAVQPAPQIETKRDKLTRIITTLAQVSLNLTPIVPSQMLQAGAFEETIKTMTVRAHTSPPASSPAITPPTITSEINGSDEDPLQKSSQLPSADQKQNSVQHPILRYKVEPHYTKAAYDSRIQGNVGLELLVGADGVSTDVNVVKSLDPGLDASAIEAVKQWQFEPGKQNGTPVAAPAKVEVTFRLLDSQPKTPDSWFSPKSAPSGNPVVPVSTQAPPNLAALTHQKRNVQFTSLSNRIIPFHSHMDINVPGYARSSCYGSGSSWNYSVNCSSYVAPPTSLPIDISYVDVYQQVQLDNLTYTLKCRAHWIGSACHGLTPNETFQARVDGTEMRVSFQTGGNLTKPFTAKYKIIDIRNAF